ARRPLAEDLRVWQQCDPEVAPDETAPCRRDGERGSRRHLALLEEVRRNAAQELLLAQRLAAVRKRDDDVKILATQPRELVLGLGETTRRERGSLRVEAERLPLRQLREHRRPGEVDRREALLLPRRLDLVGRPDEVGRTVERRHEVDGRPRGRRLLVLVRAEVELDELAPPLGRGVDRRLVDLTERTLREGRERADLLDLVAEELDAERLAARGRENIHEAAANREVATLLDTLHAFVAGGRQLLREQVDPRLLAGPDRQRRRTFGEGRQPLGDRSRRRADESTAREHFERPCALADQVRRRLQAA